VDAYDWEYTNTTNFREGDKIKQKMSEAKHWLDIIITVRAMCLDKWFVWIVGSRQKNKQIEV